MSVVAISSRPPRSGRPDRVPGPRTASTLTITLDLGAGALTPGLARLVDLLDELAAAGTLRSEEHTAGVVDLRPAAEQVEDPDEVRILTGVRVVRRGGHDVPLTRIEYDLLLFLAEHPRRVFTRRQLLTNVWGYEDAVARTVDVHVRRLRVKLGVDTPLVTTVHGVGYRLADDARVTIDRTG